MSMPVITLSPASKTGAPHPPEIVKNSREASFSSYLDGAEETFVIKLGAATTQGLTPDRIHFAKNRADDKEIDVFDAEKYFNGALNYSPKVCTKSLSTHQLKKDDHTQTLAIKKQQQPPIAALSIRSEASWNSRSALLRNVSKNQQLRKANKKSFLASIGCNCTCADKDSVDIDDYIRENCSINQADDDQPELRVTSVGRFSFPVFSSKDGNPAAEQEKEDAAKGRSQRVFGSPIINAKNKLTMVTWDAIAPSVAEDLKIPSISSEMHNEDSDSDGSSDLFEIESLYKDNPCMTPTTCYAPSEASVEWSVVTASAADFSRLSDSDEVASSISTPCPKKAGISFKTVPFKEMPRIRPSILSGCKSHKAVSVAGDAHVRRHVTPMTRFHDESKLSFDAKTRQNSFDARIISQPRSASAAHLLYT